MERVDTVPRESMDVLRFRHKEAQEQVTAQLAALRGGCGSLEAYGEACNANQLGFPGGKSNWLDTYTRGGQADGQG
jgi:hypothetical protein